MIEYFTDSWNNYYLTDVIATILILWSMYGLAQKKRYGFALNVIASALWVIWHGTWGSYAGAFMNIILIGISIYGWINWKNEKN